MPIYVKVNDSWKEIIRSTGPIYGTTGTFSDAITMKSTQSIAQLGDELVTSYDFSSSTGWTFGTGWSYDSGNNEADHTPGNTAALTQDISVVEGTTYYVSYGVSNRTVGAVEFDIGGEYLYEYGNDTTFISSGKRTYTASSTGTKTVSITPSSDFDGSITKFSVKPITETTQAAMVCLDDSDEPFIEVRGDNELRNMFFGRYSGEYVITGVDNTVCGWSSGRYLTTGNDNCFFGSYSGFKCIGSRNCFFGSYAGYNVNTGINNSFIGYSSGYNTTRGHDNVFIGKRAGYDNTDGKRNIIIGYETGLGIAIGNGNTIIGASVTGLASDLSNTVIIADGDGHERIYVDSSGNVGLAGVTSPSAKLHVPGDIYCTGKLTSDGGNDPPYILYNYETRQSVIDRIKREIPPGKLNGAVMFFNGEADRMELFLPIKGEFRTLTGELLDTVDPITETFEVETRYYFDSDTGEVRSHEIPKKQKYNLKPDHEVDPISGKILRKIKQVISKDDEEVETIVDEEEVAIENAILFDKPTNLDRKL